jgi:hypothetical protein
VLGVETTVDTNRMMSLASEAFTEFRTGQVGLDVTIVFPELLHPESVIRGKNNQEDGIDQPGGILQVTSCGLRRVCCRLVMRFERY